MHLDAGALPERGRLHVRFCARIDGNGPSMRLAFVARGDGQPRPRTDRGQRLAAKTQRVDGQQVVAGELGGSVAIDAERQVSPRHTLAVVGDADEPSAAAIGKHVDAAAACVERVFDQFLDHARRPLDHLAGGDAVDDSHGQLADGHDKRLIRVRLDLNGAMRRPRGKGVSYPRYSNDGLPWRRLFMAERCFLPSIRFRFWAFGTLVARRGTGRTAACRIKSNSRSRASARLRSW